MTHTTELTPVMKLDNDQLARTMKMAERKMGDAREPDVFKASVTLYEDTKAEIQRRND